MVKKLLGSFAIGLLVSFISLGSWFIFAQGTSPEVEEALSDSAPAAEPTMAGMPGSTPGMELGNAAIADPTVDSTLTEGDSDLADESTQTNVGEAETTSEEFLPSSDIKEITDANGEERISLDLRAINIIEILKILSVKTNKNIVPTQAVKGRVNLYINNVTFTDALDVILISNKLAADQRGDVLVIMTEAEYKALYGRDYNEAKEIKSFRLKHATPSSLFKVLESLKSSIGKIIVDAESGTVVLIDTPEAVKRMYETAAKIDIPLETKAFELQYAEAEDIKTKLDALITTGVGKVTIDERTNSILVTDLPGKMAALMQMVSLFDNETKVVFIETQILEIELEDRYQYGVNWERFMSDFQGVHLTSTFPPASTLTQKQSFVFGDLAEKNWRATFQMLNTLGDTRILSRPSLTVVNNSEASIMVGTREVYSTSSLSQSSDTTVTSESIEFIEVGVKLNVTPTINADGFITMKIKPEVSSVVDTYTTANDNEIPVVQTSESSTTVKIRDGDMIMIAGLMKDTKTHSSMGIPLLHKIPFIGAMFGSRDSRDQKKEIIVFIKATILQGDGQRAWDKEMIGKYPQDFAVREREDFQMNNQKLKGMK